MYEKYFELNENPFQPTSNPNYLFPSVVHNDVSRFLNHMIIGTDGLAMLTGEEGTGKTAACRLFALNLENNVQTAFIVEPKTDVVEFMKVVNRALRIDAEPDDLDRLTGVLSAFLQRSKDDGKKCLMIIDDAQNLGTSTLAQVLKLSQWSASTRSRLYLLLVGRPELKRKLKSRALRDLDQRIRMRWILKPMNLKSTKQCIRHRTHVAGSSGKVVFSKSACRLIHLCSGGVPRLINKVCDDTLKTAYGEGVKKITRPMVIKTLWRLTGKPPNLLMKILFLHRTAALCTAAGCLLAAALLIIAPKDVDVLKESVGMESTRVHAFVAASAAVKEARLSAPSTKRTSVVAFQRPPRVTRSSQDPVFPHSSTNKTAKEVLPSTPRAPDDAPEAAQDAARSESPADAQAPPSTPRAPGDAPGAAQDAARSESPADAQVLPSTPRAPGDASGAAQDGARSGSPADARVLPSTPRASGDAPEAAQERYKSEIRERSPVPAAHEQMRLVRSNARPATSSDSVDVSPVQKTDPRSVDPPSTPAPASSIRPDVSRPVLKKDHMVLKPLELFAQAGKVAAENNRIIWPAQSDNPWKVKPSVKSKTKAPQRKKPPSLTAPHIDSEKKPLSRGRFLDYLAQIETEANRRDTLLYTMRLWNSRASLSRKLDKIGNDLKYFSRSAQENKLTVRSDMGTLDQLKTSNLPAILEVYHPRHVRPKYLVIKKSDDRQAIVTKGQNDNEVIISLDHLDQFWSGVSHTVLR